MRRGEIWWAALPSPAGRRPVVLLSRNESYWVRDLVIVAPVTTRIRGIPAEVPLGPAQGLRKECVANLDTIATIATTMLVQRVSRLSADKLAEVDDALRFALGLDEHRN